MALNVLDTCRFFGPALPEPFVKLDLEGELNKLKVLPRTTGEEGKSLEASWQVYHRKLRELASRGGSLRVQNHVLDPLVSRLGYAKIEAAPDVETREGRETGGALMLTADGKHKLRCWATSFEEDLDAPAMRGAAYRYSHLRIAQRVLLAAGERLGLLTNGVELRILISDPARPDSQIVIPIDPDWKRAWREVPDSYRLLLALACTAGVAAIPDLVDKARLKQATVTKELRRQAREAIEGFIQEVLDHPANKERFAQFTERELLARELWREGLIFVYRLLFILKLESTDDPARSFSFASTSLWRNSLSPTTALAQYARIVIDMNADTGELLEEGLRGLFRMFAEGLQCTELNVAPLGGALFGKHVTPVLSETRWGERAVAHLLDRLLWTVTKRGSTARERVHYGALWVEDLGRVYEALLELEPGIAAEPMCRLRRQKLEVVVPLAQGDKYKPKGALAAPDPTDLSDPSDESDASDESKEEDTTPRRGKKTKVDWIEAIQPGRFYLRVGLGRKATGSYYTPHSFVRFLVQETLGPQVAERSPQDDPKPAEILKLKVLDPAMGSGHFLVEACRYLGEKLYEAVRLCDERASEFERQSEKEKDSAEQEKLQAKARHYRQRILDLPDPDDELVMYLPSRSTEGPESGLSQRKAEAMCRRLVAVHCLYGVDKNPLAVELAKLSLWIESHAEGLPLTFLDHRLVCGDSIAGPFFEHLLTFPSTQKPMDEIYAQGLREQLQAALGKALTHVRELESTVGVTLAEVEQKQSAKQKLDQALRPFKILAAAWAGGVMLGKEGCDDTAYIDLARKVVAGENISVANTPAGKLADMIALGLDTNGVARFGEATTDLAPAFPYDLAFPEVFHPNVTAKSRQGFDVVLGNPPWDRMLPADKEFFASFDFEILGAPTKRERQGIESKLLEIPEVKRLHNTYIDGFRRIERVMDTLYRYQIAEVSGEKTIGKQDLFRVFMERNAQLLGAAGLTGVVVPSAFHANEGATGIRRLYLQTMALECCYSFENRRKLFEIDSRFKFALVVAAATGPTFEFDCAFYLHNDEWLFGDRTERPALRYTLDFVKKTAGEYLSLLELRTDKDLDVALTCFKNGRPFGDVCEELGIRFGRELNMTDDAWRFTPLEARSSLTDSTDIVGLYDSCIQNHRLIVHEGKSFWHYTDLWDTEPAYSVSLPSIADHASWIKAARYYRAAYRAIASSTNERTVVFTILPPGGVFGNSAPTERNPWEVSRSAILTLIALANSFVFDWTARVRTGANLNQFILFSCPYPKTDDVNRFLRSATLRLCSNHTRFGALWQEQLGADWREEQKPFTWPVLNDEGPRWALRAAIDAVVAFKYGFDRSQYLHILSCFSHKSYPKAPELCLARFDELKQMGLEAFTKKYDPYWDIPLNENLPEPVIDLPLPAPETATTSVPGRQQELEL